jgi:hypothetical protein
MSKTTPIYEALTAIMADCGAIGKGRRNQQQGYSFRGIDDLYNAIHPLFAKHGVFVTSEVIERHREERQTKHGGLLLYTTLRVKFTFYSSDGSSVSSITEGEAMDSADKSTNKAMSAALKYCLMQMLLIPTEELKDADAVTPEPAPKPKQKPVLSPESPRWQKAVAALSESKTTIEQVLNSVQMSEADKEQLLMESDHLKSEIENQQDQKR